MRGERAPEVLPVGAVGGDEVASCFPLSPGARPGDDGARQLAFVVQVPDRAFLEAQLGLFDEVVLLARVECVDLHRERATNDIKQGPHDLLAKIGRGEAKRVGDGDEACPSAAFAPKPFPNGESCLPQLCFGQ